MNDWGQTALVILALLGSMWLLRSDHSDIRADMRAAHSDIRESAAEDHAEIRADIREIRTYLMGTPAPAPVITPTPAPEPNRREKP